RRPDRGPDAPREPPCIPARGARARDEARARDLRPRPALRRARHRRRSARGVPLKIPSVENAAGPRKGDSRRRRAGLSSCRRLQALRRETVVSIEGPLAHIRRAFSGRLARTSREEGFGLVEMVMATTLFLTISAPLVGVLLASVAQQK